MMLMKMMKTTIMPMGCMTKLYTQYPRSQRLSQSGIWATVLYDLGW
jgi:hypothetical protein